MLYKIDFSNINTWRVNSPTDTLETLDFQNIDVGTGSTINEQPKIIKPIGGDFKAEDESGIKPTNDDIEGFGG